MLHLCLSRIYILPLSDRKLFICLLGSFVCVFTCSVMSDCLWLHKILHICCFLTECLDDVSIVEKGTLKSATIIVFLFNSTFNYTVFSIWILWFGEYKYLQLLYLLDTLTLSSVYTTFYNIFLPFLVLNLFACYNYSCFCCCCCSGLVSDIFLVTTSLKYFFQPFTFTLYIFKAEINLW